MVAPDKVHRAQLFAIGKHMYQTKKDSLNPYTDHLTQVVSCLERLGINDQDILCAGWLHDTIEYTSSDFDEILKDFGESVAKIVSVLTRDKRMPEKEGEIEYIAKLRDAPWQSQVIKFCELSANIADLINGYASKEKRLEQVDKKLKYFEPIRGGLKEHQTHIPNLQSGIDELNSILSAYQKQIAL